MFNENFLAMGETNIAIAGTGNAAEMHATAISDLDGIRVIAAASRNPTNAERFANKFDCEPYTDVEGMLDRVSVDVLHICTPSGTHLEPALAAIDRGIDILCEKPLEISTDRIDEMIHLAETAGVRLGGVFQQRFNPVLQTVRKAVEMGRFGDLSVANTYVPWWRDDEYYRGSWRGTWELDGGGAMMNQSIHGVDAIQWLASGDDTTTGDDLNPVSEVFAYTDMLVHDENDVEVEDTAVACLRYRDGTLGHLLGATSMYPGSRRRLEIAGRDGTAVIKEDELETWSFRDEQSDDENIRNRFGPGETSGGAGDPMDMDLSNHRRNIRAFAESRTDDSEFPLNAREARKSVEIIEAVYESAERGQPVRIE